MYGQWGPLLLETQVEHIVAEIEGLEKMQAEAATQVAAQFDREKLMAYLLKVVCSCQEAIVVENIDECIGLLPVTLSMNDEAGKPTQCTVHLGGGECKTIQIKPTHRHFLTGFSPSGLRWLPAKTGQADRAASNGSAKDKLQAVVDGRSFLVFFAKNPGKFILSRTHLKWQVPNPKHNPNADRYWGAQAGPEYIDQEDDFSDIAVSLNSHMEAQIKAANGELDLEQDYPDNLLLAHAKSFVVSQTTAKPIFMPCAEVLGSTDIYKKLKAEWDLLAQCPWSKDIQDPLALLKYHVENGEKARFWSGQFEGHYGFRLRTRDHDWVVGQIYLWPVEQAASAKNVMVVHSHSDFRDTVASLGRMFLCIWLESRRR